MINDKINFFGGLFEKSHKKIYKRHRLADGNMLLSLHNPYCWLFVTHKHSLVFTHWRLAVVSAFFPTIVTIRFNCKRIFDVHFERFFSNSAIFATDVQQYYNRQINVSTITKISSALLRTANPG